MKKLLRITIVTTLFLMVAPVITYAIKDSTEVVISAPQDARAQELNDRLMEIQNIDKSYMTFQEKRELRKEVKAIEKEMSSNSSSGVYISAGALIVIIILLIILL